MHFLFYKFLKCLKFLSFKVFNDFEISSNCYKALLQGLNQFCFLFSKLHSFLMRKLSVVNYVGNILFYCLQPFSFKFHSHEWVSSSLVSRFKNVVMPEAIDVLHPFFMYFNLFFQHKRDIFM